MTILFRAYPALRPLLFRLEAEKAHEVILKRLARSHQLGLTQLFPNAPIQPTQVMGLTLRNPVGLAAGLDKNGAYIDALSTLGFGFIEVGTVTPLPQAGNPQPRLFRIPKAQGIINRMGFNNQGLDNFLENVKHSAYRDRGGILGLNIGKNASTPIEQATQDYLLGLNAVYPHADYVTVNISSPNTSNLRALQEGNELSTLLKTLKEERQKLADQYQRYVPIALKIAPDLEPEQLHFIVDTVLQFGIDALITCNTTLDKSRVSHLDYGNETGGLSGEPVNNKTLTIIHKTRQLAGKDLNIIGVGGIMQGHDALQFIQAGADAIQLYTGLIYKGPQLIHDCCLALK